MTLAVEAPTDAQLGVYLIHLEPPYKHARHYLGFSEDIAARVLQHRDVPTKASPLIQAALAAGGRMWLVRVWLGADRTFERRLKRNGHVLTFCPLCRDEKLAARRRAWAKRVARRRRCAGTPHDPAYPELPDERRSPWEVEDGPRDTEA